MENLRIEFPKRGVNLNYTLSNRYDGTGVFFKKKVYLSLLGDSLSILIQIFYFQIFNFQKMMNGYKVTNDC